MIMNEQLCLEKIRFSTCDIYIFIIDKNWLYDWVYIWKQFFIDPLSYNIQLEFSDWHDIKFYDIWNSRAKSPNIVMWGQPICYHL
jgi:hypothetical protein